MSDQATDDPRDAAPPIAVRDERGDLAADFVEAVEQAIAADDAAAARKLAGTLHEADVGDLLEALDADERARR